MLVYHISLCSVTSAYELILKLNIKDLEFFKKRTNDCSSRRQMNKYYIPPIVKGKPNIAYWSDPETQRITEAIQTSKFSL